MWVGVETIRDMTAKSTFAPMAPFSNIGVESEIVIFSDADAMVVVVKAIGRAVFWPSTQIKG